MDETLMSEMDKTIKELLSLTNEELEKIFSEFSLSEIEDLINKLEEVQESE